MPRRSIWSARQRAALFDLPTDEAARLPHYTLSDDDIEHIWGGGHNMAGLNLLAAIVIHWNTAHLGEAVRQRKHAGLTVEPELLAHILLIGEYQWPKRR